MDSAAAGATECAVEETQRRTFNSTLDGLRKIAKNEGPTTLWRGLSPTLVMAIPANVIYFTGYDWLRYNHASPIQKYTNDTYNPLISGSIARVTARDLDWSLVMPLAQSRQFIRTHFDLEDCDRRSCSHPTA